MRNGSDQLSVTFEVYSPRWGHTDRYSLTLTSSKLSIHAGMKSAEYSLDEDGAGSWSGYNDFSGNPLMQIFSNDSIYAPEVVPEALGWVLEQWRDNEATTDEIVDGLRELFGWIDQTARGKPSSDFWQAYF